MGGRGNRGTHPPPKIFSEGDIPPKIPRRKKIGEKKIKKREEK